VTLLTQSKPAIAILNDASSEPITALFSNVFIAINRLYPAKENKII
jgi:hypothetical protein